MKFSLSYSVRLPCYGTSGEFFINGRTSMKKGKQSFLFVTQYMYLNLIYVAIKFHHEIPKGSLVMGCAKSVLKLIKGLVGWLFWV